VGVDALHGVRARQVQREQARYCSWPTAREQTDVRAGVAESRQQACTGTMAPVKETELWQRLRLHLGAGYFRVWASEYSLAALGQRTVVEALADGVPCKIIWRAVWAALELPARER
jgi:Protein of unknown function (DUF3046)